MGDENSPSVTVYRLRLSRGTESSHVPDWRIYEDVESFEADLLDALIEEFARRREPRNAGVAWRACRSWLRHVLGRETHGFGLNNVIGAEVLHDGKWVDLRPVLVSPSVSVTLPEALDG